MADRDYARDEQGRFSSEGGGSSAGNWAKSVLGVTAARTPGKVDSRQWTDKRPEGMHRETWQAHFDAHPLEGGQPSAERVASVHEPIVHDALDHVRTPGPGEQKVAIFTMGGPASGKSSIVRGIDAKDFVKVDADAIKERLPEYQRATDPKNSYREAAPMAHEESSYLAKQIRDRAADQGKHMIIDATGANAKNMVDTINNLKAKGYETHVLMPHLSPEKGLERANLRAEATGRHVPPEVVRDIYSKVPHNFERVAAAAHAFSVFDAHRSERLPSGKMGSPLVWSRNVQGKETHHDPSFVREFKGKYGSAA